MTKPIAAAVLLFLPSVAAAQDRDLCAERPGLGAPACTVEPGHVLVETGLVDWTRDRDDDGRVDTIAIADTVIRVGVGISTEMQFGWTPYGHQRERDATGAVTRTGGVGDVMLGVKQNLANPDGQGLSFALTPFVTLPVGREPTGAGDWGAGLIAPLTYDLSDAVQLAFTAEVDAAVDEDGDGRHLAYSGVAGIAWNATETVALTGEVQALRDRDPTGRTTQYLAALSAAWLPSRRLQLDIGTAAGLNHDATDFRLYGGVSALF